MSVVRVPLEGQIMCPICHKPVGQRGDSPTVTIRTTTGAKKLVHKTCGERLGKKTI